MLKYTFWWKDLEGEWIKDELEAADFGEACDKAELISNLFGTGEIRVEIFGRKA